MGGVRGTPGGAAGWGGLLGVDCRGGGGGGGSAGSAPGRFLASCCDVSWLALAADWAYWAALTALEGWPRKLSRTASCSWVS